MDKEALLHIILSDINEIETLVKSFTGMQDIPKAFIELTEKKLENIMEEFNLLKSLNPRDNTDNAPKADQLLAQKETVSMSYAEQKSEISAPEIVNSKSTEITSSTIVEPYKQEASSNTFIEANTEPAEIKVEEVAPKENSEPQIKAAIKKEIVQPTQIKTVEKAKSIGESFAGEKKSVNDIMASNLESNTKKTLIGKPIEDLTKGLGINDRFLFQRELFGGNNDVMIKTLQQLNELPDIEAAQSFISSNFNWNDELEATKSFYNYIKRKY